jgi:hypothetical protein
MDRALDLDKAENIRGTGRASAEMRIQLPHLVGGKLAVQVGLEL